MQAGLRGRQAPGRSPEVLGWRAQLPILVCDIRVRVRAMVRVRIRVRGRARGRVRGRGRIRVSRRRRRGALSYRCYEVATCE